MIIAVLLLLPLLGAVAAPMLGRKKPALREIALQLFTLAELALAVFMFAGMLQGKDMHLSMAGACGLGLSFQVDGFRALYAMVAAKKAGCRVLAIEDQTARLQKEKIIELADWYIKSYSELL